jgi:aerobic-type carbon monoxide dehydrogenase small subunit (CoxS/CutS family)
MDRTRTEYLKPAPQRRRFVLEGDTLLVAMLAQSPHLRHSESGDGTRAGFCLMGACQDCWVLTEEGERVRACSTVARAGMRVRTILAETTWPNLA